MTNSQQKQTDIFNKYGAFFAFSKETFSKCKKDNVKYVSLDGGLIVPKKNVGLLIDELRALSTANAEQDIANNGIKKIIHRELANHECQISCEYDCVVEVLADYGITRKQIADEWEEFYQNSLDNDCF